MQVDYQYDHRFGHNRSEGFEDYVHYGRELGMEVLLARAYSYSKEASVTEVAVSSGYSRSVAGGKRFGSCRVSGI